MSHFVVYAFSKNDGKDLEELFAPYNENKEVEPYVFLTKEQAIVEVRKEIDEYRNGDTWQEWIADPEAYKKKAYENSRDEEYIIRHLDYLENVFPKMLYWTDEECYENRAEWYIKDGLVDENGNLLSTYNPKAKWDYYDTNGGWNGCLHTNDGELCNDGYVDEIDWEKTGRPFAFITPDGEWHERGKMGWWAIVTDEKEEDSWEKEYRDTLKKLLEDGNIYVTVADCHI